MSQCTPNQRSTAAAGHARVDRARVLRKRGGGDHGKPGEEPAEGEGGVREEDATGGTLAARKPRRSHGQTAKVVV